jgi:phosphatidylglycerol lysyltransferase
MSAVRADGVTADAVLELLRRHGYNTNSFLWMYPDFEHFVSDRTGGLIAYVRRGAVVIAAGDPLCEPADQAACLEEFRAWCDAQGRHCLVLTASERLADLARPLGFSAIPVGASPYFDVQTYSPRGDRPKKVRSAANQARRLGLVVREYRPAALRDAELEAAMLDVCHRWAASHRVQQLSFLLRLEPFAYAAEKRYFVATRNGRVEGFLACSPIYARKGWYFEDLLRRPDATNGTTELLVLEAIRMLRAEGYELATLGASPLMPIDASVPGHRAEDRADHPHLLRALDLVYRYGDALYQFRSLHHYKAKYAATRWEVDYCLCWPPAVGPRLVLSVFAAFAGSTGVRELVSHKVSRARTATRGRAARYSRAAGAAAALGLAAWWVLIHLGHAAAHVPPR